LLLTYLIQGTDRVDAETLRNALQQGLPSRGEELMPTLAEQWTKQGREQGRQEGRQEGRDEGELIGKIQAFQEVLGLTVVAKEDLLKVEIDKLRATLDELRSRLNQR
jgi:predicted transposase YdaD